MPDALKDDILQHQPTPFEPTALPTHRLQPLDKRLRMRIRHEFIRSPGEIQEPFIPEAPRHEGHQDLALRLRHARVQVRLLLLPRHSRPDQAGRVGALDRLDQRGREVGRAEEVSARRCGSRPGLALRQPRPVGHEARVVRAADGDDGGGEAAVVQQHVPRGVAAETDAEHEVLDDAPPAGREDVARQEIEQQRRVGGGADVAREHVLGVALVSGAPGLVGDGRHEARPVVALVERHGDEADFRAAAGRSGPVRVPLGDDVRGERRHARLRLQSRMQQPEHRHVGRVGTQLAQPKYRH